MIHFLFWPFFYILRENEPIIGGVVLGPEGLHGDRGHARVNAGESGVDGHDPYDVEHPGRRGILREGGQVHKREGEGRAETANQKH